MCTLTVRDQHSFNPSTTFIETAIATVHPQYAIYDYTPQQGPSFGGGHDWLAAELPPRLTHRYTPNMQTQYTSQYSFASPGNGYSSSWLSGSKFHQLMLDSPRSHWLECCRVRGVVSGVGADFLLLSSTIMVPQCYHLAACISSPSTTSSSVWFCSSLIFLRRPHSQSSHSWSTESAMFLVTLVGLALAVHADAAPGQAQICQNEFLGVVSRTSCEAFEALGACLDGVDLGKCLPFTLFLFLAESQAEFAVLYEVLFHAMDLAEHCDLTQSMSRARPPHSHHSPLVRQSPCC